LDLTGMYLKDTAASADPHCIQVPNFSTIWHSWITDDATNFPGAFL